MKFKKTTRCVILPALMLVLSWSCVSKEQYGRQVEEREKLSTELTALKSEYRRIEGERDALEKERMALQLKTVSLEQEVERLKQDNTNLEEILQAKSGTLNKQIVELREQLAQLRAENETLQSKALALEVQRKEEVLEMKITYEDLLQDMKSEIEKGKITITQLKGKLKVNMVDEILFDSGKAAIKPQGVEVLQRVGKILLNVKDQAISIEGHTDNVPIGPDLKKIYPTNWELSAARAMTVARYLQEKIGVAPGLLSATGYGEHQPIASNETEEGRAKNRRIEIVLIPKEIAPSARE